MLNGSLAKGKTITEIITTMTDGRTILNNEGTTLSVEVRVSSA
jgi:hypothetical protein